MPSSTPDNELREQVEAIEAIHSVDGVTTLGNLLTDNEIEEIVEYIREREERLIREAARKISTLESHLAYMAGEFEGYHGHKNGYLLKNWKGYAELSEQKKGNGNG